MNKLINLSIVFCLTLIFTPEVSLSLETEGNKKEDFKNTVILKGLNKITARVSTIEISLGQKANFGNLDISLLKCWKSPPEEEPENKALLKIWEQVPGEDRKQIFYGWMFTSSPAISALEHPVYDINVIGCHNKPANDEKEN